MKKTDKDALLRTLQARFDAHPHRHPSIAWSDVATRLLDTPDALAVLHALERTGGEPDVVARDANGPLTFMDCAEQSPDARRSLCYDAAALAARKEAKPAGSAVQMAADMGAQLLTEAQYRALQQVGAFDTKTSSWLLTPAPIRSLGGAIFGDRRYDTVFIYHNGVQSYYAGRGFRCAYEL